MHTPPTPPRQRIAITGMGLCNALGHDPGHIWQATLDMRSGLTRLRQSPGDPPRFYEAPFVPGVNSYCDVAALCDLALTRHDLQLPPQDFLTMPSSSRLSLLVARQALEDSGLAQAGYDPQRVGVFISQNAGEAASTLWDLNLSLRAPGIADLAARHGNWTQEQREAFLAELRDGRVRPGEGSMLSRINCMVAGMLCRRYGFSGPAYSMGAACSSSMAALFTALHLLRDGTIDAALIGGGEEMYAPLYMAEFAALGALARAGDGMAEPADYSRPFDRRRNGFVLGEGAGMLVLERESTARQRGASLYGLITGMGHVTNVRGLIEPDADSQVRAIRASFAGLDYGPEAVDLVEAHATSTLQGDLEEGRALAAIYGNKSRPTTLSAYKAQIGHTTGASGVSAIIHGLLSMRDGIYPGTRNCPEPDPAIPLREAGLRLFARPEAWDRPESGIRRLQVNSFAFGGACFALQVEEPNERCLNLTVPGTDVTGPDGAGPSTSGMDVAGMDLAGTNAPKSEESSCAFDGHEDVVNGVRLVGLNHKGQAWRLGSVVPGWIHEMAGLPVNPGPEDLSALSRKGLWLHKADTPPPVAVMCCGQGSVWPGMGRALYDTFPAARAAMDRIAAVAQWDVLGLLDEPELEKIILTRWQQPYLFLLEYAQASYLESLGFKPSVMSGHSLGELIALCLAGVYTPEQAWHILDTRATHMSELEANSTRDTGMMAVHGSEAVVEQALRDFPGLHVSNYNTPTQVILSGPRDVLMEARRALRKNKVPAIVLNVSMAFHHPSMRVLREISLEQLNRIDMKPPRLPMFSNITTGLYPDDRPSICEYIGDLDENSVRWVECVRNMWKDYGVRHFVELGPADTLCGLTADIEPQALCIPLGRKGKEVEGLRSAVARLYALGHIPRPRSTASPAPGGPGSFMMAQEPAFPANAQAVSPALPAPATSAIPADAPRAPAATEAPPHVEEIMPLIMEATGYERHELGPDMDLRHDLAIRSSRFPLIMSAAEERFQISVRFEDLMGVATIRDLADTLARLRERPVDAPAREEDETPAAVGEEALLPVVRHVPQWHFLPAAQPDAVVADAQDLAPGLALTGPLLVVGASDTARVWAQVLREQIKHVGQGGQEGQKEVLTAATAAEALEAARQHKPGTLVLALDAGDEARAEEQGLDLSAHLALCMQVVQAFLSNREARLCLALGQGAAQCPTPLHDGLSALLLSTALEYPKAAFRSLWSAPGRNRTDDLRTLLHDSSPIVQWRGAEGEAGLRTPQLRPCPLYVNEKGLPVERGHVLLVSGGGKGITPFALRGLAGLGCTLALLGRGPADEAHVRALESTGATVRAYACDVTDAASVESALHAVRSDWGRIDGLIHAAGLNRDATLAELSPQDMEAVLTVKCRGLRLLLENAAPHGLRYAVAFSSLAAWLGNYGQSNYSAANRAMSALLETWCHAHGLPWRCIWLPPVTGEGMADSAETRRQLALRGLNNAWLDVAELGDLLHRELCCGGSGHVLWLRALPALPTVAEALPPAPSALRGLAECPERFPLVFPLSLRYAAGGTPVFIGGHHFSVYADAHEKGRLLPAPRPGAFCASPGVLMACLREAALQLMPSHDSLCGTALTDIRFGDMLLCPQGVTRETEITASPVLPAESVPNGCAPCDGASTPDEWTVHAHLRVRDLAPNGRRRDSWSTACEGLVHVCLADGQHAARETLPSLWETLPADQWERAAQEHSCMNSSPLPARWMRITAHEEIAQNEESGYSQLWGCLELLLQGTATRMARAPLLPVSLRAWRRVPGILSRTPDSLLLEVRLRESAPGTQCWDAQWARPDGTVCMTMEALLLATPQEPATETEPR